VPTKPQRHLGLFLRHDGLTWTAFSSRPPVNLAPPQALTSPRVASWTWSWPPRPRPTPPLLFSLVKLMPPWRAVVGESPSSLQPTINSPTLPSRSSHHPAPPCRQLPPDWPATGADTALERASPVSPGGASPWAVGPATWAWLEASPCEQWDFLFSTGFYFNQFK
jgi:hypothetical protein